MSHPMLDLIGKITALAQRPDATKAHSPMGAPGPDIGNRYAGMSDSVATVMRLLQQSGVLPGAGDLAGQVGGRGFLDTLGKITGGFPTKLDTMPGIGSLADFNMSNGVMNAIPTSGMDQMFVEDGNVYTHIEKMDRDQARTVSAHEFGHLLQTLEPNLPGLLKLTQGRVGDERFADEFAMSLSRILPDMTHDRGYPFLWHGTPDDWDKVHTMDSIVADKVRKLAKPRPSQDGGSYP